MLALERAHSFVHRAARAVEEDEEPGAHLARAARALEGALGALYDALDRRDDPASAIRRAEEQLARAGSLLAFDGPGAAGAARFLQHAVLELVSAGGQLPEVVVGAAMREHDAASPRVLASHGVPRLHDVRRPSLTPSIRVLERERRPAPPAPLVLPEPKSFEELKAALKQVKEQMATRMSEVRARAPEVRDPAERKPAGGEEVLPHGFGPPLPAALGEGEFVAAWARECFEEVGMLGIQRAPLPGDHWRAVLPIERRMLVAIDAFAALGARAAARLESMALDAPAPDPMRVFAAVMIGGCLEGRDALGAAERVLWRFGAQDPDVAAAFAGAMKLVPHPRAALMLRSLRAEADPAYRALAVEVLAYRGWMSAEELAAAAMDESPVVAAHALPELGLTRHPALDEAIERALAHEDVALRESAWAAMAMAGHPRAAEVLRAELGGPLADRAAVALAIVGGERDAKALLERSIAAPNPGLIEALGWAGSVDAVPHLIGCLEHEDPSIPAASASALDRILGARLYEEVEVPPEKIETLEGPKPDTGERRPVPLGRLVSHPRDMPSNGSKDVMTTLTTKFELWQAYWRERERGLESGARHRRGHLYTPAVVVWEVQNWTITPAERRVIQRELVFRTGRFVRFDPQDFVSAQGEALTRWETEARSATMRPGRWSRPEVPHPMSGHM